MKYLQSSKNLLAMVLLTVSGVAFAAAGLVVVPGQPLAEDFTLPAADGSQHQLSDYRGAYVLVNFWATWCTPCIRELPSMQRTYTSMKERDFEILAIHAGAETPDMQALLERFAISFPVLLDADLALVNWNVSGLPASFLLDPEGRVVYQATGAVDWDSASQRKLLEQLLDGKVDAVEKESVSAGTI